MTVAIHKRGNIGTDFILTIRDQDGTIVDISTATSMQAIFRSSPKATSTIFNCVHVTDGSDGQMRYITVAASDLDPAGSCWQLEGEVVIPGKGTFRSNTYRFKVAEKL